MRQTVRLFLLVTVSLGWLIGDIRSASPQAEAATPSGSDAPSVPRQVLLINRQIQQGWEDRGLKPSRPAASGQWCRRVYLDLIGRVPTVEELHLFLADRASERRTTLVNRLLGDEYREEFSRHWSTIWTNLLIGRTGGTTDESLASRSGMEQYLRRSFQKSKPYDRLVQELIVATGSCRPGDEDFNGAANFLADKMEEGGIQATAKTAQIFLGMAVQCTQCHNHPFNEYRQNQFWELNAFFRQTLIESLPNGEDQNVARVYNQDFPGEGRRQHWRSAKEVIWEQIDGEFVDTGAIGRAAASIYYELRNGKVKTAFPVFVDGTSLESLQSEAGNKFGNSGYLEHVNRRQELAKFVLDSPEMSRAIVNRMWSHFFGYGFTKPIDDRGPHNPPTHPELLEQLGDSFQQASYDLTELMRWIVLSTPYGLSSRMTRSNKSDDPTLGTPPMFSHFYMRQMQAEQLYETLLIVTSVEETLAYDDRARSKQRWLDQFNTAFGTDENDESTTFNGSIPQVLMMMNGDLMAQATGTKPGSFLARVAGNHKLSNPEKIRHLYLAAMSRKPSREELALSNQLLSSRSGNVVEALQDIWWALLNSNEFVLNH